MARPIVAEEPQRIVERGCGAGLLATLAGEARDDLG